MSCNRSAGHDYDDGLCAYCGAIDHDNYTLVSNAELEAHKKRMTDITKLRLTPVEIFDSIDMAETFPGSGVLNWGEVGTREIYDWAFHNDMLAFDIESVKMSIEKWWKKGRPHETV